jgi:hypothetical protein
MPLWLVKIGVMKGGSKRQIEVAGGYDSRYSPSYVTFLNGERGNKHDIYSRKLVKCFLKLAKCRLPSTVFTDEYVSTGH